MQTEYHENMLNLIVYGSLLHPDELQKHGIIMEQVEQVKVKGFRRIFNQEPTWRKIDSIHRAVMNIEPDPDAWFNALVIRELSREYIDALDVRERGYDRIAIPSDTIESYHGAARIENCVVYQGKKEKRNNTIHPNREYFRICLEGAGMHCEDFYEDYLATTYKNWEQKAIAIKGTSNNR